MTTPHKDWTVYSTLEEAVSAQEKIVGWISHILINDDGSYSILGHINAEWCDYCAEAEKIFTPHVKAPFVHLAKDGCVLKEGTRITMLTNLFTGARAARIEGKNNVIIRQREQPEEFERLRKIALANR